ncbi:uncharacterized protein LOC129957519 [Argiope bruennichi]|uniref:uncharacterized protein LOC129957519 n=1 Tax=Argiope bruennichi TaxID=94029 RepID=UPI002494A1F0|nr:uncharacterized protein LOC129957519 [Argiope bruennichi]
MADCEIPVEHLENEPDQVRYRQGSRQFSEIINNNAQIFQHIRPDNMQWKLQRMKTIKTLNELREKLDVVCVGASYGKGFGNGAQISGAVTAIVGAIMALGKSSSAATVMNFGSLINNSGTLVGGMSNIIESYISAEYLREVKAVLEKDKELSEPLQEWLAFSRTLDANMQIIFGYDLNSIIQNNVLKVFSEFTVLYNSIKGFNATIEVMNKGQYAMHIGTDVTVDKLLKFSKELDVSPQLGDTVVKLSESFKLLQVAKDGVKVYQNLFGESATSVESPRANQMPVASRNPDAMIASHDEDSVELVSNHEAPFQAQSPSVKAISAFCAFQAVDIATCVVSLISAVTVIRDGKSKFSDAIKQISDLLDAELRSLEELNSYN